MLETTGNLNIIPVSGKRPVTPDDLNIKTKPSFVMITVISDGKLIKESLAGTNHSEDWLKNELAKRNIRKYSDVFYAAVGGDEIFFQKRGEK